MPGAVVSQLLLGSSFKIMQSHGEALHREGVAADHCNAAPIGDTACRTDQDRDRDMNVLLNDLRQAGKFLRH
jgi:hypothetical protein